MSLRRERKYTIINVKQYSINAWIECWFVTMEKRDRKERAPNDDNIKVAARSCLRSQLVGQPKNFKLALENGGFDLSVLGEDDVRSLVARVKVAITRLQKDNADYGKPEVLQKPNFYRIQLVDVDDELKTYFNVLNDKWQSVISQGESALQNWTLIEQTNLSQLKLQGEYKTLFRSEENEGAEAVRAVADSKRFKKLLIAFFKKHKLVGVQCDKVHMSIIYNSAEEVIVQDAHTDFEFKKATDTREKFAWTANIPMSKDGSYIIVWNGPGYGTSIHVPFGKCLFLRGDVVHAGGRPDWSGIAGKKFLRMHFYLPTKFMPADPENVFVRDLDGNYLSEHYLFPLTGRRRRV
jgi:hypothetical protein